MSVKKTRLELAEEQYGDTVQEWLNNPRHEDLPNEIVDHALDVAFGAFLQALLADEEECAAFIAKGNVTDELVILPLIFEHFKSVRIYEAIVANCEVAISHIYSHESMESEEQRRSLIAHMKSQLNL